MNPTKVKSQSMLIGGGAVFFAEILLGFVWLYFAVLALLFSEVTPLSRLLFLAVVLVPVVQLVALVVGMVRHFQASYTKAMYASKILIIGGLAEFVCVLLLTFLIPQILQF